MNISFMKTPTFNDDGVEIKTLPFLQTEDVRQLTDDVYSDFTPARNAKNQLSRGVRWGVMVNGEVHWTKQNSYQLSAKLNEEEGGNVRIMDLVPDRFLKHDAIRCLINEAFQTYYPNECTELQAFGIQVSAIRYEPSVTKTCYPSPDRPHQDGFDNGIFVLNRTDNLIGGQTRVFTLEDQLMYEANLEAGQAVFVRDDSWKHQVLPMMVDTQVAGSETRCYRDILIVRITRIKR